MKDVGLAVQLQMPNKSALRKAVQRKRKIDYIIPAEPQNLDEIIIPEKYRLYAESMLTFC